MIEETIVEYLGENLNVPVSVMHPEKPPQSYVVVERTSGGQTNQINRATIAIQSYGPTMFTAGLLNEEVKEAMEGILELDSIGRCHLDNDYMFTDITRKQPRYQAVYDLRFY